MIKRKVIQRFLNETVDDSLIVCEINVYDVDDEEKDYEVERGLKYDIYVYINHDVTKVYNQHGVEGLKRGIYFKIRGLLRDWFNLDENEYFIGFLIRECNK